MHATRPPSSVTSVASVAAVLRARGGWRPRARRRGARARRRPWTTPAAARARLASYTNWLSCQFSPLAHEQQTNAHTGRVSANPRARARCRPRRAQATQRHWLGSSSARTHLNGSAAALFAAAARSVSTLCSAASVSADSSESPSRGASLSEPLPMGASQGPAGGVRDLCWPSACMQRETQAARWQRTVTRAYGVRRRAACALQCITAKALHCTRRRGPSSPPSPAACEQPPRAAHKPMARCAPSSVFCSSMAMVMGPTPPGTGVMAPATGSASAYATSPTRR